MNPPSAVAKKKLKKTLEKYFKSMATMSTTQTISAKTYHENGAIKTKFEQKETAEESVSVNRSMNKERKSDRTNDLVRKGNVASSGFDGKNSYAHETDPDVFLA